MLFTSVAFFPFLILVFLIYYLPVTGKLQLPWLVAASLFFYALNQLSLVLLLLAIAAVDIVCSHRIVVSQRPRLWAIAGVVSNLLVLAFFKYNHLFASLFSSLTAQNDPIRALFLLPLPIGISFYTFHGVSLLIDTFRREPTRAVVGSARDFPSHMRNTLLYISFFPQLIAGPIMKARDFYPQIGPKRFGVIDWDGAIEALIIGYFLKVVVADNLSQQTSWLAYPYFLGLSSWNLLLVLLGYSAQIFADFAGYSLIAIGLGKLFGYNLPTNFLFPYISETFAEFWTRWHMSLSAWLREYLYFPLGGNRKGRGRTYFNLMTVMTLGGLWHGAAISYAVWGCWHGCALVLERACSHTRFYSNQHVVARVLRGALVFFVVSLGWLLFKLPNFHDVLAFFGALGRNGDATITKTNAIMILIYASPVALYHLHYVLKRRKLASGRVTGLGGTARSLGFGLLSAAIVLNPGPPQTFIYFQF
jgi:alginate O-acetyltransferase complex protein AlgI